MCTSPSCHPAPIPVQLLVEEGHANMMVCDRFGNLPIDDARCGDVQDVVDYLQDHMPAEAEDNRCVGGPTWVCG